MGQAATKSEAVAEAERAIDRALSRKKLRLLPREDRDWHEVGRDRKWEQRSV